MIDDGFKVCSKLLLSVVLAKRRPYMVPVRVYLPVPYPGGGKKVGGRFGRFGRFIVFVVCCDDK
jgi:hypothetical protein